MHQDKDAECGVGEPTGSRLGRDEPIAAVRVGYDEQGHFATASKLDVEDAQLRRVPWNNMVLVVAQHNLAKPFTDRGHTMMLSALKLGLDGFELRDHSLLRRNPPDDESFVTVALPTEVGETQEREGLWFALSTLLPVSSGEPPELDQSCLVRV